MGDIKELFRSVYGQYEQEKKEDGNITPKSIKKRSTVKSTANYGNPEPQPKLVNPKQNSYEVKIKNLAYHIDSFTAMDMVRLFYLTTKGNFEAYPKSRIGKEVGMMKNLLKDFDQREIYLMAEYLVKSNQDYIKPPYTIGALISVYQSKIYQEAVKWSRYQS